MSIIFLLQMHRTFFFLRIFDTISPIVKILYDVLSDLRAFMLFYFILLFLFCQIYSVLGLYNEKIKEVKDVRKNEFLDFYNYAQTFTETDSTSNRFKFRKPKLIGSEYKFLGLFMGNIFGLLRAAKGGADFGAMGDLTKNEQYLFWILWFCITMLCGLMFLKFLVAESR